MSDHLGRVIWRETMTKDLEQAKRFYAALFAWSYVDLDMGPGGAYPQIQVGGKSIGGMMQMQPGMAMPPYWTSYVLVADVDAACAAATAGGGSVPWGPVDVPGVGRMAMVGGPDGAMLSLIRPTSHDAPPVAPPVPGEFCWETLTAADVDQAKAFWPTVCPWVVSRGANIDTFAVGEGMENQVADIQSAATAGGPPSWLTYVVVEKIEPTTARAVELGGQVFLPAMAIPNVGRIAVIADDQGAVLGLFEPGFA